MATGETSLAYAVRFPVVAKYLGQLALVLAFLTLAPLTVSLLSGEHDAARRYGLIVAALVVMALPAVRLRAAAHVQINEALVIVALAFVLSPLLMSYPMMAAGLSFGDALFEAISGITTTGLTVLDRPEDAPPSLLFARAWMQWYGGLGIVVLSVALLLGHHMASRRLMEPVVGEAMVTTARSYARHILFIYLILTAAGFALLWLLLGDAMIAGLHILAGVSTGGFSPYSNNLAGLDTWTTRFCVMMFALCGAVPLIAYYRLSQRGWRAIAADVEVRALLVAVGLITLSLAVIMQLQADADRTETLLHAILLGISAQTGTGFSSLAVGELGDASKLVLIFSMFVGGGVGSTTGGIKLLRLLILLRLMQLTLRRTALSEHAVMRTKLGGRTLENEDLERALLLILLFAGTIAVSWLIFVAYGYPPLDALFEVVSATATVGLSTGITGSDLHAVLKAVLCIDMLLGRLEIIALLVVLYPHTWFGRRAEVK
jgi:trk system potassium uptake protein TrkH